MKSDSSEDLTYSSAPRVYEEREIVKETKKVIRTVNRVSEIIEIIISIPFFIISIPLIPIFFLLFLIFQILFFIPKKIYNLHKAWVIKFGISDIRIEIANPLEASVYFLWNSVVLEPPIINLIFFVLILGLGIPIALIFMIYKIGKEKIVTPVIGKILYTKKEKDQLLKVIEFLEDKGSRFNKKHSEILGIYKEMTETPVQIDDKYYLSTKMNLFLDFGKDIFRLLKHLKIKKMNNEVLYLTNNILNNIQNQSKEIAEVIPFFIQRKKEKVKLLRKQKFTLEGKDYQRKFFFSTFIQKIKLRREFHKEKRKKISLLSSTYGYRDNMGILRDYQKISEKFLRKVSKETKKRTN